MALRDLPTDLSTDLDSSPPTHACLRPTTHVTPERTNKTPSLPGKSMAATRRGGSLIGAVQVCVCGIHGTEPRHQRAGDERERVPGTEPQGTSYSGEKHVPLLMSLV